jgi:hypothetical protein
MPFCILVSYLLLNVFVISVYLIKKKYPNGVLGKIAIGSQFGWAMHQAALKKGGGSYKTNLYLEIVMTAIILIFCLQILFGLLQKLFQK